MKLRKMTAVGALALALGAGTISPASAATTAAPASTDSTARVLPWPYPKCPPLMPIRFCEPRPWPIYPIPSPPVY